MCDKHQDQHTWLQTDIADELVHGGVTRPVADRLAERLNLLVQAHVQTAISDMLKRAEQRAIAEAKLHALRLLAPAGNSGD